MKQKGFALVLLTVCALIATCGAFAAESYLPPSFQETFSLSLGDYWCENHLSVADMDGDGRKDIVLMGPSAGVCEPR